MFIHTNCFCRLCAGRNMSTFTGRPVISPLSPSFHHRIEVDSPPSPLSIYASRLSISNSFSLPSPISPLAMPARDLPLSPISPYTPTSPPWSPTSEYSTESATSDLSIAELTAGDFPSPSSPYNTEFLWDMCVIPSVPCNTRVFAAEWRDDSSCPFILPAKNGPCESSVSPTTLPNGRKAVCSATAQLDPPPLPPRPSATQPTRPLRSPLLHSKMSWSTRSTPFASPGFSIIHSPQPQPFRLSRLNCAPIAEGLRKAGPCSSPDTTSGVSMLSASDSISIHTLTADQKPLTFSNAPWWSTILAHTYSHSSLSTPTTPTSSIRQTPSIFYRKSDHNPPCSSPQATMLNQSEVRFLYWDFASAPAAAEYAAVFGKRVEEDEFAWIRYPVPGPHDLCRYDDDDDDEQSVYDEDEQSTGYNNWHHVNNPTAADASDPFADFDGAFAASASSTSSSSSSSSPFRSVYVAHSAVSALSEDASIPSSSYSGVRTSILYATTLQAMRAHYISGYLSRAAVEAVKEVCTPAYNVTSIDQIVGVMF